jgi:hypothetical protein
MSTNPKDAIGLTKPALRLVPPALALHVATAMSDGAKKYGAYNWRENAVRNTVYVEAALRHLYSYLDGEDRARDSGRLHLAHVGACVAILLDALEYGNLIDDRATAGPAADIIDRLTPPATVERKTSGVYTTDIQVTLNGQPFGGLDEPIPYTLTEPQPLVVPGDDVCFVCEHELCQCPQKAAERPRSRPTAPYFLFENELNDTSVDGEKICMTLDVERLT